MAITLPKTTSDSKALLFFSGGKTSKYLADQLEETNGSLENTVALFLPLTAISTIKYSDSQIKVKRASEKLASELAEFRQACEGRNFAAVIEFVKYEDFDFKNSDNFIGDRGRLGDIYGLMDLIIEKNPELSDLETIVFGFNKESKQPELGHSFDSLVENDRVFTPFKDMTKEEVSALVS
jgi:hypothetical protein